MTIGDFWFLNSRSAYDTIKIQMYSLETGWITVLEETPLNDLHEAWRKFTVTGFTLIPYRYSAESKVCIIARVYDRDLLWKGRQNG